MFNITKQTPPYFPKKAETMPFWESFFEENLKHHFQKQPVLDSIFLHKEAFEVIKNHIGFGNDTQDNQVEQGGLLFGEVIEYQNAQNETKFIGIVNYALAATTAEGSMRHLHFNHATWHSLLEEQDKIEEKDSKKQLIGWYHTHPRHLEVYFSHIDKENHLTFFDKDWHFGLVLNPQRKEIKCFLGNKFEEVLCILE
ncbi:Mov34/MPN/PAD-1 family protein [Bernardetia sp. OM2101]|uniref:Mov34/MPN/PAD-1 family protein n=1 Tax=Bernardetia sp. OM2101 TaxID=3344876 RepID=UPI0035CFA801